MNGHVEDEGLIAMVKAEVIRMKSLTGFSLLWILKHLSIKRATYHNWLNWRPKEKTGFVHPHKALRCEEEAVIEYAKKNPGIGYKKLTYQMLDEDIAALGPSQVYRILSNAGLLDKWGKTRGAAGKEYKHKPAKPNEHWHTDIMYVKILERWCFLIALLDGYSRYIVGWKLMPDMTAQSVSLFMQEVIDTSSYEGINPVLINDNGSQLISRDFKKVLLAGEIQQRRIRRNHPQSNGKIERFNGLVRQECLRPHSPVTIQGAEKVIADYVDYYNNRRVHSAIDFMRPADYYMGNPEEIRNARQEKLISAKKRRIEENREFNSSLRAVPTSYSKHPICLN